MYQLTPKAEKQFRTLKKRFGGKLTRKEFGEYYTNIRRANAKGRRLAKNPSAFTKPQFTYNIKHLTDRATFLKYKEGARKVLWRGYLTKTNYDIRERFKANLRAQFSESEANRLIIKIDRMSDAEFKKFATDNAELNSIIYGNYEEEPADILYTLDINERALFNRLNV